MKLHLHFVNSSGPTDRPKLVMTQFWADNSVPTPVTVTYQGFSLGGKREYTKGDYKAFCQLILHATPIKGDLATALYEVARRSSQNNKPTLLQLLFGQTDSKPIPPELLLFSNYGKNCKLGSELQNATIQCFLHDTAFEAIEAEQPVKQNPAPVPGAGSRKKPLNPLDPEACRSLGNLMLGGVRITELKIDVLKDSAGQLKDGNAKGVLPLNSKDLFELKVTCNKPAHFYVFWIGSSGTKATPIFPWLPTKGWADTNAKVRDQPREGLVLTQAYHDELPESSRQFRSVGNPGAEMLVVLAHIQPLNRKVLQTYFSAFPRAKVEPLGWRTETEMEVMPLETGLVSETADYGGAPDPVEDALDRVASWLGRLQMPVDDAKGLVIPTVGGK